MSGGAWSRARSAACTSVVACLAAALAGVACAPKESVGKDEMVVLGTVQPPTWGGQFRGKWLVRVETGHGGGGADASRRREIIADGRGCFRCSLPRPLGAATLEATITVVGGPGYRSAQVRIVWPAGAQEPRITCKNARDATRADDLRRGALYRIVFVMTGE
jgi:hypothetical protein